MSKKDFAAQKERDGNGVAMTEKSGNIVGKNTKMNLNGRFMEQLRM